MQHRDTTRMKRQILTSARITYPHVYQPVAGCLAVLGETHRSLTVAAQ